MSKFSIKSLALFVTFLVSTVSLFAAGTGSSTNPYLVCGTSGFKLTSSVAIPTNGSIKWFKADGTAITGATAVDQTFSAMNTDTTNNTLDTMFKIVVYSEAGCPSDSGKIYLTILPPPTVHATADNQLFCSVNASSSTLALNTSTGGTPSLPTNVSFTYAWTGSTGTGTITNASSASASTTPPSDAGAYTYTVAVNYSGLDVNTTTSNATGCKSTASVNINVSQTPSTPASTIAGN